MQTSAEKAAGASGTGAVETDEFDLSSLYVPGVSRASVFKLAPLDQRGHCGEVLLGPGSPPSRLLEDIRRSHGPGRYQIRPLNDKGAWAAGQKTIEIAPRHDDAPPASPPPASPWEAFARTFGAPAPVAAPPPASAPVPTAGGGLSLEQVMMLARMLQPQQPQQPQGSLEQVAMLARMLQGQQPDMTALLTALVQQREAATNPIVGLRDLFELVNDRQSAEPSDPSDRMMRMMEMVMLMKVMGPMMGEMGGGDPREMMAMMSGRRPPGPPPQRRPPGPPQPQHPQPQPQRRPQPQPPREHAQADDEDDDAIPTPAEVIVDLEGVVNALPPEQRGPYLRQVAALAMANGLLPPEIFGVRPAEAEAEAETEEPAPHRPTLLGGGWSG